MNGSSASMSSRSRSRKRRERDGRVKRLGYEELESLKHETEKLGQAMSETTERELKTAKLLVKEKAKHAETKSDAFLAHGWHGSPNNKERIRAVPACMTTDKVLLASKL